MQYFEIIYDKSYYCIGKKYVKTENGVTDAIRKTRLKNIIDVEEITQEFYEAHKPTKAKKERFIL